MTPATTADNPPSVSLVIATHNGREHLRSCLDSVAELNYPRERLDTIVVDNASTDGSRELLRNDYPWVKVLAQATNLGFAGGVNAGARAATSELLTTCNNDMRLDSRWLQELVRAYDAERGYVCVSGLILDWDGKNVDFADGYITAYAHARQPGFGRPLDKVPIEDRRELPFPCGGSFLVSRDIFLDLGGFDESYFALFEDVDFGWRLQLAGYRTRLAAGARSYHRHHASVGALPPHSRSFLYERNALRTLLKNVDDENLAPMLAFALFNLAHRSALTSEAATAAFAPATASNDEHARVPKTSLAGAHAAAAVAADLEAILEMRARVQALRRRSDREIFASFGRPFRPQHYDGHYLAASARLLDLLGLGDRFAHRRATTLLVLAKGLSSRLADLAQAMAADVRVVFASPERAAFDGVETLTLDGSALDGLLAESDVVLVEASSPHVEAAIQSGRTVAIDPDVPLSNELRARNPAVLPEEHAEPMLRNLLRDPPAVGPPEPVQVLLARWRRSYGVGQPFSHRLLRVTWDALPERVRNRVRDLARRRR